MKSKAYIKDICHYHPDFKITNELISSFVDTSNEWIVSKVGIKERRYLQDYQGEFPVFEMCKRVVDKLVKSRNFDLGSVDMLISCSSTEDLQYPSPANMLDAHYKIGCPAFHLKNGCPTVVFAIQVARGFIQSGLYKNILLVCGEPFTTQVDYSDRRAAALFGDASVALVISSEPGLFEIEDCELGGKGSMIIHSTSPNAKPNKFISSLMNNTEQKFEARGVFFQEGKEVYKFVSENMPPIVNNFLKRNEMDMESINYFVGHQANLILLNDICKQMKLEAKRHLYNVDRFGNTSSAGWVSVLSESIEAKTFLKSEKILISVFGAGLSWGNLLIKYVGQQAVAQAGLEDKSYLQPMAHSA